MEIVINIPKELYENAKNTSHTNFDEHEAIKSIANGRPLPKGQSRLGEFNDSLKILNNSPEDTIRTCMLVEIANSLAIVADALVANTPNNYLEYLIRTSKDEKESEV